MTRPLFGRPEVNRGFFEVIGPNERKQVLDLHARCVEGEVLSIVFGVERQDDPCCTPAGPLRDDTLSLLRAHISWGLGACSFNAMLDIENGMILGVPTENIVVDVEMIVVPKLGTDPCLTHEPPVRICVGLSYGEVVTAFPRLTDVVQLAPGDVAQVSIPPFARSFTIVPAGTGTLQAEQIAFAPGPQYFINGPLASLNPERIFPLINGVKCLEVKNLSAVDNLTAFVIFQLDL